MLAINFTFIKIMIIPCYYIFNDISNCIQQQIIKGTGDGQASKVPLPFPK